MDYRQPSSFASFSTLNIRRRSSKLACVPTSDGQLEPTVKLVGQPSEIGQAQLTEVPLTPRLDGRSKKEDHSSSEDSRSSSSSRSSVRTLVNLPENFTHKWPRPLSVRKLDTSLSNFHKTQGTGLVSDTLRDALEESHGLGLRNKWPKAKFFLMLSVCTVFVYGVIGLWAVLTVWFRTHPQSVLLLTTSRDLIILLTISFSLILFTALLGFIGTLLNSRPTLAIYALLLWPCFLSLVVVGYPSYKRSAFSLELKLNEAWSEAYTPFGRLTIQNALRCCGYWSSTHGQVASSLCYPRSPLPGCKGPLLRFSANSLRFIWVSVFSLVPLHLLNIVVSLLCANHVTERFGKGITPRKYWLSGVDLRKVKTVPMIVMEPERSLDKDEEKRPLLRP